MRIGTISGSSRPQSANTRLLESLPYLNTKHEFVRLEVIEELPLFRAELDSHPWPEAVLAWRTALAQVDALIICMPEYIHNLPALIKNALEWVTSSGELSQKSVLPITFTPHPPRGERAMQSLIWSLQALDARIVSQLPLYQKELVFTENGMIEAGAQQELLQAALDWL